MLPGGARGVSPPGCPPPSSATYIRPPAAPRPQLTTPELRPEPRAAGKRGGSGGFLGAVVIPSLEPLTEKTRLSRWSLPQARWSGSNKKKKGEKGRGEHSGGPERAASPYLPPPAVSGSSGPSPPTPPLPSPASHRPSAPQPGPAGPSQDCSAKVCRRWVRPWRQAPFSIQSRKRICCARNRSKGSTEAKLKRNPALPEPRAMRFGPQGAAASARPASPFPAVGNLF